MPKLDREQGTLIDNHIKSAGILSFRSEPRAQRVEHLKGLAR